MSTEVLLPLVVFFALGVPILVLLWHVFVVGGELRRYALEGRAAVDLARRADTSLAELSAVIDGLRRRRIDPDAGEASLHASAEALRRYAQEAQVIDRRRVQSETPGMHVEIERAQRAVELIEYGRKLMLDRLPERISEGETSVKRGYLNLLHARESIRARAEEIAAAAKKPPGTDPPWGTPSR
jgi:hypothetical protein